MSVVIRIEKLGKSYRRGMINRGVFFRDWMRKFRGDDAEVGDDDPNVFWALRDFTLDVKDGEVVGLLGRNGAGKSTLLKILSQITAPTRGTVKLRGRVASLLEVGTGFHLELTGRDNIFLNGTILGMTRQEVAGKFDEIVAFSGIEDFIDTPVKRYSVGMRVRLAFAVAAHLEPEILLIDEVLAVGDAAFQKKCLGKIDEVAHAGRTVIFVSHDAAAIESLCTRGVVIGEGRVAFDGSPSEALDFYSAARLSSGVNLTERNDRSGSGAIRVETIEVRNEQGVPVASVRSGQEIELALRFRNQLPASLPHLSVQIMVSTHLGAPVFCQANWLEGVHFEDLPKEGVFRCRIPKLPLPVGHFRVGFQIHGDPKKREALDAMEHAMDLMVESGDFFGVGKLPKIQTGVCLVEGHWRVEPVEQKNAAPVSVVTA